MLGLERLELVEQRVVLVVGDLGVVEDVVAVDVVVEDALQLLRALGRGGRGVTRSRSRRAAQEARQVVLDERVEARVVGEVEVDRRDRRCARAATAARSVPGSSW